jgi:DNA-binding transcriptional LysR family regulator
MARQFDHMADVEAFVTIIDKGTISAAAVALGTTPSVLSRAVARLEARLGVQLMRRTTRRLSITEAGTLYLDQARSAFGLIADAERAIQGQGGALSGKVRISVPTTYGHYRLPALLRPFMEQHPQVTIELSISNRNVDLVAEGYDMAIRLGELADSGLAAKPMWRTPACRATSTSCPGTPACPSSCRAPAARRHGCCGWTARISTGWRPPACW